MVNSAQRKLDKMAIVHIALENTDSQHPLDVALPAVITEMSQPNTAVQQFGNTIFVLHKGQDGKGVFKAFNADTAPNFFLSSKQFLQWAAQQGMKLIVTDFKDPQIMRVIKMISEKPPLPGMGFQSYKLQDGGTRVAVNLGGAK